MPSFEVHAQLFFNSPQTQAHGNHESKRRDPVDLSSDALTLYRDQSGLCLRGSNQSTHRMKSPLTRLKPMSLKSMMTVSEGEARRSEWHKTRQDLQHLRSSASGRRKTITKTLSRHNMFISVFCYCKPYTHTACLVDGKAAMTRRGKISISGVERDSSYQIRPRREHRLEAA